MFLMKPQREKAPAQPTRRLVFNQILPSDLKTDENVPLQVFARNKIRTAIYTPLTFIPKNLWLQFHNVANVYFLFVTILAIFPIFGATNPALGSVPLIVILLITAIKDAIEDFRRTVLDNELNNTFTYILDGVPNPNVADERISAWRKIKKLSTRFFKLIVNKPITVEFPLTANSKEGSNSLNRDVNGQSFHEGRELPGHHELEVYRSTVRLGSERYDVPKVSKVHGPNFKRAYWKNIRVGDIVRVHVDEEIPADIIVLSTSSPDGTCYLETKNLDGETNLKCRMALDCTKNVHNGASCGSLHFEVESELPHANLFSFHGVLRSFDNSERLCKDPISSSSVSIDHLLLRGCTLRNTAWVIGFVVFTGDDTKIMMNLGITPSKRSRITQQLNSYVIINFLILLIMCLVSGVAQGITWAKGNESLDFFEFGSIGGSAAVDGIITFWTAVILFQNLVPISLYISIEIVKLAQAFFIFSDIKMYYEALDYPCTPKSWNLSDDLGRIEYVFTDKTGTLTQNLMEFRKCSINGRTYGVLPPNTGLSLSGNNYSDEKRRMLENLDLCYQNPYIIKDQITFVSSRFAADLHGGAGVLQQSAIKSFLLALSICHTALPDTSLGDSTHLIFKAQSPDEVALVATARDLGFAVINRGPSSISVNSLGVSQDYEILRVLEFSSARKRMSCVVRFPQSGKIFVICKGADNVIFSRLANEGGEIQKQTAAHLEQFGSEGLRTLCIAEKEIDEDEFRKWDVEYELASKALQCREEKVEAACDLLEVNFHLLGGTAIEDRLQEQVPETIKLLSCAGIKVWVLTGDKVETAVNIGFSCNLLDKSMTIIKLKFTDSQKTEFLGFLRSWVQKTEISPNLGPLALVIDGECLKLALDSDARDEFLKLCQACKAVLCCRVSPSQKAAVVQFIKKGLDVMTLAIGDGANDVAMIQEAEIGVGIAGEEGRQAVMSSDYAIGQFKYLSRLLLVHGRWSYRRLAEMVANFFYKNIVWTLALFWYQLYNNFDGTYLFEYSYILLYNIAFTSLPIILMAIFDQDVEDSVSLAVPQLYTKGILGTEWTPMKFWLYMLDGCYQSLICFFTTYFLFQSGTNVSASGLTLNGREQMGVFVASSTVFVVNAYVLLNLYRWDWISLLVITLSILMVWFWTGIYSQFQSVGPFYKTVDRVFGAAVFWAVILLTVVVSLLPRFTIKVFGRLFMPKDIDVIREQAQLGQFGYPNNPGYKSHSPENIEDDEEPICKVETGRGRRDTDLSAQSEEIKA